MNHRNMHIEEREFIKFLTINQALAERSIETYLIRFRVVKRWLNDNNLELTPQTVVSFLFEKKHDEKLSNSTVNTYRQTLVHIDGYCKFNGLKYGFTDGTKHLPKIKPEVIFLSEAEMEKLLSIHISYKNRNGKNCNNLDERYRTFGWFLLLTGCRFSEGANLTIDKLDIGNGRATLINTKNKENRIIFFDGPIKDFLEKLIKNRSTDDLVFTNSKDTKIASGVFNDDLKRRAKFAEITKNIHIHTLRHTFATVMYRATRDINAVSKFLGHKDIRVTSETYVHLVDDELEMISKKHPLMRRYQDKKERLCEALETMRRLDFRTEDGFNYQESMQNNTLMIKISY